MEEQVSLFIADHLLICLICFIVTSMFVSSDLVFLGQFHDKAMWYQYWKYNIDDTKYHFNYCNATWFGKIILWVVIIIPRLIILTPLILIYMVISFIVDILRKMLYKR